MSSRAGVIAPEEQSKFRVKFLPDWKEVCDGVLEPGGRLHVSYDAQRLTACRMRWREAQVWDIEAHIRFHPGGELLKESVLEKIREPPGTGAVVDLVPRTVEVVVPIGARRVELWFHNFYTSAVGGRTCDAWDSRFGRNYWYEVMVAANP